jgi:hypothetical protein
MQYAQPDQTASDSQDNSVLIIVKLQSSQELGSQTNYPFAYMHTT